MAEFVMKDLLKRRGRDKEFYIYSSATSAEEEGSPVHYGTVKKLKQQNVAMESHFANKVSPYDYDRYDYIIAMEERNIRALLRIFGGDPKNKVSRLLDFSENPRDIADPWWTGDFDAAFDDIYEGCNCLADYILKEDGKDIGYTASEKAKNAAAAAADIVSSDSV